MAISGTISQDKRFPIYGETLALRARGCTLGNRVRFRIIARPDSSGMAIYTATHPGQGWLRFIQESATDWAAKLNADTDGRFTIEAVEESYDGSPPHFEGDDVNTTDDWSEVTTESFYVYIGRVMERVIGHPPDTCILRATAVEVSAAAQAGPDDNYRVGVITWKWDQTKAPMLIHPTTEKARAALENSTLRTRLQALGGENYDLRWNLYPAQGSKTTYTPAVVSDPGGDFLDTTQLVLYYTIAAFNIHRVEVSSRVHLLADTTHALSSTPTSYATLLSFCSSFESLYGAHVADTEHHTIADAVYNLPAVPYGSPASTAEVIENLVYYQEQYEGHRLNVTGRVHGDVGDDSNGDGFRSSRLLHIFQPATSATVASACVFAAAIKAAYNNHISVTASTTTYHVGADTTNIITTGDTRILQYVSCGVDSIVRLANRFHAVLDAHFQNYKYTTGSASAWHSAKDHGSALTNVPLSTDWKSAVSLIDRLYWSFIRHIDHSQGAYWHGNTNPGSTFVQTMGVTWLSKLYLDACVGGEAATADDDEIEAVKRMSMYGGFERA